jgi:class 3 adenylate cyclase
MEPQIDPLGPVLAVRDCVKDRLASVFLDENTALYARLATALEDVSHNRWSTWEELRFHLFHVMLDPVAPIPILLEASTSTNGFRKELQALAAAFDSSPSLAHLISADSNCLIRRLVQERGILFFVCNYFTPFYYFSGQKKADPRHPAIRAVSSDKEAAVRVAYEVFLEVRKRTENRMTINDLISLTAARKRVWAIQFVDEDVCSVQDISTGEMIDLKCAVPRAPLILKVPIRAFATIGSDEKFDSYLNQRIEFDELVYDFLPRISTFSSFDSEIGETTAAYINALFFPGKPGIESYHAYCILMSLLPFYRSAGMRCHYAFPAHFAVPGLEGVPRAVKNVHFCSTLSIGSLHPLSVLERKIISDLSARLLLTPLLQDYALQLRTISAHVEFLTKYLGPSANISEILDQGDKSQPAWAISVFADLSGFTKACRQVVTELRADDSMLHFLQELWTAVTAIVHEHGGAVGGYAGDGIFFYFADRLGRNHTVPQAELACRAFACVLALQAALLDVWQANKDETIKKAFTSPFFHIGMSCGQAVVGNIVGNAGFHYTAISHKVNAAARYCDLADRDTGEVIADYTIIHLLDFYLSEHGTSFENLSAAHPGILQFHNYASLEWTSFSADLKVNPVTIAGKRNLGKAGKERYSQYDPYVIAFRVYLPISTPTEAQRQSLSGLRDELLSTLPAKNGVVI